jgi:hypothetical protein
VLDVDDSAVLLEASSVGYVNDDSGLDVEDSMLVLGVPEIG